MKSAIVPAQITTVEDKIAGNLTLQQMFLIAAPVFLNFILYALMPRSMHLGAYKVVLMTLIAVTCSLLAIRIKGKILLIWIVTIVRYNLRPRYHVFDKNDVHLRDIGVENQLPVLKKESVTAQTPKKTAPAPNITTAEIAKLENIMSNPAANLSFKLQNKGGLRVSITEVER